MTEPGPNETLAHVHAWAHANRLAYLIRSLTVQLTALVFLVSVLIWTVLFTGYSAIHDPLHALRHALYLIPCH
jgi:hypothetical protein